MIFSFPDVAAKASRAALLAAFVLVAAPAHADYPIASHRYLADPASLVHDGRLYLYASNDDDNVGDDGYKMASIVCVSSSDLKNWTDHGEVLRVPGSASWANMSWAPAVIERNGTIFLYFGNNANGIGVASSATPTGPFTDAKGSALVNSSTPGASGTNMWLFDPSVFVDDDGQAYLYFGGNGEGNARVIKLNSDMVSVSGSAIAMTVPYFFEASWMHKRNGTYYFSYSTNPENGMRIDYLTSSSPTSGFVHQGTVGDQPPSNNNNNHAAIFEFEGKWYHAYHNRHVANEVGDPPGYRRSLALEALEYAADGLIQEVTYTTDGVQQLSSLNPYQRVEAETFNAQSGIETEPSSVGGMALADIDSGDWILLRGVDFGTGASSFSASAASATSGGTIELRLDEPDGTAIGDCAIATTSDEQTWATTSCEVSGAEGVHDLYLKFTGGNAPLFNLDFWQFTPIDGGGAGSGGSGGGSSGTGGHAAGGSSSGASGSAGTGGLGASGGVGASAGTSGAPALGGAPAGGSGTTGASSSTEAGGCGCRAATGGASSPWSVSTAIVALVLGGAWRRRSGRNGGR
jgi:arabinoxylan arabinofuranohydrolase